MWEPRKKWDRNRPIIFKIAMTFSLGLVLMAFNIKSKITESEDYHVEPFPQETEVIRTPPDIKKRVLPPPTPPKPTLIDLPKEVEFRDEIPPDPKPDLKPKSKVAKAISPEPITIKPEAPAKAVMLVEPKEIEEPPLEPMLFAQRMPVFGICDFDLEEERRACSNQQLIAYVYDQVRYPSSARAASAEGSVVARFVIDMDGKITDIKIVRDFGFGSANEVTRVLKNMPNWQPGKQNGRRVPVIMTLPVKFTLNK